MSNVDGLAPTSSPAAAIARPRLVGRRAAFFLLASITATFLAGSLAPTPLYPVYQAEWGFSALTVTLIFGVYALALLGSLLVAGRLSDHLGRRPVLIVAALVQVVAMALFIGATGPEGLMAARVVQGVATGAALGAVGAGLLDLDRVRGPIANSIAPMLGTGLGGLLAGLMAHYLPAPTTLVYVVLAAIFILQAIGVVLMEETVAPIAGAIRSLAPQLRLPTAARRPMALAAPVLVAVWSIGGFYASLGPAVMHSVFGLDGSLGGGGLAFLLAGGGAATVLLMQRAAPQDVMAYGSAALLAGMAVSALALAMHSVVGFAVGALVAGTGFGAGFQGAVRLVAPTAEPHERAGVLSLIFVVCYLAMGVPAMIAGFFLTRFGNLPLTADVFAAAVALLAAASLLGLLVTRGRG